MSYPPWPPYPPLLLDSNVEQLIRYPAFARGTSREVFDVATDQLVIVKRQIIRFPGANIMEWQIWNAVKSTAAGGVFGQCHSISETGQYLIMERLDDITQADWGNVPNVPAWLNDKKPSAFGKDASGLVKVRDYALVDLDRGLDPRVLPVPWATSGP
jgi:hypothetical protein